MRRILELFGLLFIYIILISVLQPVYAQYGEYGAAIPPVPQVTVEKFVSLPNQKGIKPENQQFVANILASDPEDRQFAPNDEVFFKIIITNTSNETLDNIHVVDIVPDILDPAPGLDFSPSQGTVSLDTGRSEPGQVHTIFLRFIVFPLEDLPDENPICRINKVQVFPEGFDIEDEATAQVCVATEAVVAQAITITPAPTTIPVKKIPSAGPEMNILLLTGELLTLGFGIYLRKK